MDVIEDFALENNCDVLKIEGRKGWLRPLRKLGFEQTAILLEKEI